LHWQLAAILEDEKTDKMAQIANGSRIQQSIAFSACNRLPIV
jgi:hypothetical protein